MPTTILFSCKHLLDLSKLFLMFAQIPLNATPWTVNEVVLWKRCNSHLNFLHLSSKASWNFPSVLAFFSVTESSSLTLSRRSWKLWNFLLWIRTKTWRLSQPALKCGSDSSFHLKDSLLIHRTNQFLNFYRFKFLLFLPRGSSLCNYMNMKTSASLQLCNKQQMQPFRHPFVFLCHCFMILALHMLLKAILHTNHYIKAEAQGQPLSTCQHDESISPAFIYNK